MMTPAWKNSRTTAAQIESYLCRKNGGHLVRIVGPAFEKVRSWAARAFR